MMENSAPAGVGGGARPPPFTLLDLHGQSCSVHSVAHSLDQQESKKTSSCPVQYIEQRKCIKLTIDTNAQLTLYKALHFSEGP